MAGPCNLHRRMYLLGSSLSLLLALAMVCVMPLACKASSLSSFWQHELPHTSIPEAFEKMESPLSPSQAQEFLAQLKTGSPQASKNDEFCSSAGIYCSQKAVIVRGPQPRVCIPPFFMYMYGVLPCPHSTTSASAVQTSRIFFSQGSLSIGQAVQLPDTSNDLKWLRFLPASLAKALPELNEHKMPELAKFYGVEKGSDMEFDMENTVAHCAYQSEHEVKACKTSAEGMVSFVVEAIGHNNVAVYTSSAMAAQEAKVVDIAMVSSLGDKVASCHDMKFPSLLYSCHMTETAQLMEVSLKLVDGSLVHMPAICHLDTSNWNPSHIAFHVLNVKPGKSSVCHWFPENSFIFV